MSDIIPTFVFISFIDFPKDLVIDTNVSIKKIIMNFLSIDCSTEINTLFIKTKNKTFNKILQRDKSNSDLLMGQIIDFFEENNLNFKNISEIFVNQGPGNFSSLRGSLSTAKGISLSMNIDLYGYNTFLWSCSKFINKSNFVYSIIKFREKYFIKKFDENLNKSSKVKEVKKDEIISKFNNKLKVIPKSMERNFDEKILNLRNLNIVNLDHKDLELLYLKGLLNKNIIKPFYLL